MAAVTEIASFYPRLHVDFSTFIEAVAATLLQHGATTVRFAQPTDKNSGRENDGMARLFIDWPGGVAQHKAFMDKEDYKPFRALFATILRSDKPGVSIYHVDVRPFPPTTLDCAVEGTTGQGSKVADVLRIYFPAAAADKDGWKEGIEKQAQAFLDFIDAANAATGWVVEPAEFEGERCTSFVVFLGWDSVEVQQSVELTPLFGTMDQLKGVERASVCNHVSKSAAAAAAAAAA